MCFVSCLLGKLERSIIVEFVLVCCGACFFWNEGSWTKYIISWINWSNIQLSFLIIIKIENRIVIKSNQTNNIIIAVIRPRSIFGSSSSGRISNFVGLTVIFFGHAILMAALSIENMRDRYVGGNNCITQAESNKKKWSLCLRGLVQPLLPSDRKRRGPWQKQLQENPKEDRTTSSVFTWRYFYTRSRRVNRDHSETFSPWKRTISSGKKVSWYSNGTFTLHKEHSSF